MNSKNSETFVESGLFVMKNFKYIIRYLFDRQPQKNFFVERIQDEDQRKFKKNLEQWLKKVMKKLSKYYRMELLEVSKLRLPFDVSLLQQISPHHHIHNEL